MASSEDAHPDPQWAVLITKWPRLFPGQSRQQLAVPIHRRGIECELGWYDLVDKFLGSLQARADVMRIDPPRIAQIKEKFGELRVHFQKYKNRRIHPEFLALADELGKRSLETCEVCGKPGRHWSAPWWVTRCNAHHNRT
jgi:hypothetical protein